MSTQSTNFKLFLAEGNDVVNLLTQMNPNTETIDATMKANQIAGITLASHIKSGTIHTLTRTNTDIPMFRFTATAPYKQGDSFFVDGVAYGGVLPDGNELGNDAFRTGGNVLCCVNSGVLTIYSNSVGEIDLSAYMQIADYVGASATGKVQNSVNSDNATLATTATTANNGENLYTETKVGTVHNLVGIGNQGRFIATTNFEEGDTFTVNGVNYNVVTNNGEALPSNFFVAGGGIRFFLAGGNIYFF